MPYDEILRARYGPDAQGQPRIRVQIQRLSQSPGYTITIRLRGCDLHTLREWDWRILAGIPQATAMSPVAWRVLGTYAWAERTATLETAP